MRGQAHTLEAIVASFILLSGLVFALQATAVTPLTGSTSNQHIENQQGFEAGTLLDAEIENGTVHDTLLNWDADRGTFNNASDRGYTGGGPPTAFGRALNESFLERGIAFNVNVYYYDMPAEGAGNTTEERLENATRERQPLVYLGTPSSHATAVSRSVTLTDDDMTAVEGSYFAQDAAPESDLYHVVDVEVVLWRM